MASVFAIMRVLHVTYSWGALICSMWHLERVGRAMWKVSCMFVAVAGRHEEVQVIHGFHK